MPFFYCLFMWLKATAFVFNSLNFPDSFNL